MSFVLYCVCDPDEASLRGPGHFLERTIALFKQQRRFYKDSRSWQQNNKRMRVSCSKLCTNVILFRPFVYVSSTVLQKDYRMAGTSRGAECERQSGVRAASLRV